MLLSITECTFYTYNVHKDKSMFCKFYRPLVPKQLQPLIKFLCKDYKKGAKYTLRIEIEDSVSKEIKLSDLSVSETYTVGDMVESHVYMIKK